MKIFSMETSLSSSQKPNKFALQPIKACKTFEHFQLGDNSFHEAYFHSMENSDLYQLGLTTLSESI